MPQSEGGESVCELLSSSPVSAGDVLAALNIGADEANLIFRNHVLFTARVPVARGDRVAFFPPSFAPSLSSILCAGRSEVAEVREGYIYCDSRCCSLILADYSRGP